MNRFVHWLLRRGLGDADARVLLNEMEELYDRKAQTKGRAAVDRWRRRELLRAGLLVMVARARQVLRPAPTAGRLRATAGTRESGGIQ